MPNVHITTENESAYVIHSEDGVDGYLVMRGNLIPGSDAYMKHKNFVWYKADYVDYAEGQRMTIHWEDGSVRVTSPVVKIEKEEDLHE